MLAKKSKDRSSLAKIAVRVSMLEGAGLKELRDILRKRGYNAVSQRGTRYRITMLTNRSKTNKPTPKQK